MCDGLKHKWRRARALFPNWSPRLRYEWVVKTLELEQTGRHMLKAKSGSWTRDPEVLR